MRTAQCATRIVAAWLAAALLVAPLAPALAQEQAPFKADRLLEGKVLSDEGKPIQKATVKVRNLDTGEEFTSAPTGPDGAYKMSKLPPGRYEVSVQTERGIYLGNRTVDLVNKNAQTYSFALKSTTPEEALEQARAARGEEDTDKPKAGARPPTTPSDTAKTSVWSNPGTAIVLGLAIAVGAAIVIDEARDDDDDDASPN